MTTQHEDEIVVQYGAYDPFPQPQTIPAGWDVSVFSCEPETAGATEELSEIDPH